MADLKQARVEEDDAPPHVGNSCASRLKQQQFGCCISRPVHTPRGLVVMAVLYGLLALAIGGSSLAASEQVVEIDQEYTNNFAGTLDLTVSKDMDAPVFVYYEITNLFQNHREYVKSLDADQLAGEDVDSSVLEQNCDPAYKNGDNVLYPCGLVPNSRFNDTFQAAYCAGGGATCTVLSGSNWERQGIDWSSDDKRFKARALKSGETRMGFFGYILTDVQDEDFIVWTRPGTGSTVRKLYRIIKNQNLKKDDVLRFNVTNIWNATAFDGKKSLVLSTMSWNGGKNVFLGWAGLAAGIFSLFFATVILLKDTCYTRVPGDLKYFHNQIEAQQMGDGIELKERR